LSSSSRGPFLTSPLTPMGEICPLGQMFTPSITPRGEHSLRFRRMEGWTDNFIPRGLFWRKLAILQRNCDHNIEPTLKPFQL
jgi:hypothetical protein